MKKMVRQSFTILILLLSFSCASDNAVLLRNAAVAVWDFDNLSPSASEQHNLGELLSGQVIEVLQKQGDHPVIEREQLFRALEELQLGATSLATESTRLRLGRISGARFMVFGGYQIIGAQMRLDVRLVEVETAKVRKAVQRTTPASDLSRWLGSAREAAEELFR